MFLLGSTAVVHLAPPTAQTPRPHDPCKLQCPLKQGAAAREQQHPPMEVAMQEHPSQAIHGDSSPLKPFAAAKTQAPSQPRRDDVPCSAMSHLQTFSRGQPRPSQPSSPPIGAPSLGEWVPCLRMWRTPRFPAGARPRQPLAPDLLNEHLCRVFLLLCW
ncbi:hypothetical protein ZWY2020_008299 [Hordeum vulgare]|nr:hypothetical protein ZWY2020_008299 [Hordeum vulgare]